MSDILAQIAAYKRDEIAAAMRATPLAELSAMAADVEPPRGFLEALRAHPGPFALIAEIKKASPSRGLIRADFDPARIAADYARAGASCLSVLTDGPSFQGAPEHLTAARQATSLPVLRKDFLFEPYQVAQSRAQGADCILVILAAVTDDEAKALIETAAEWAMDVLVEVHDEAELARAAALGAGLIGINNRDLKSFVTTLHTTVRLAPGAPEGAHLVSESGIFTHQDVVAVSRRSGVTSFLVGESLMRQPDVFAATRALLAGTEATANAR